MSPYNAVALSNCGSLREGKSTFVMERCFFEREKTAIGVGCVVLVIDRCLNPKRNQQLENKRELRVQSAPFTVHRSAMKSHISNLKDEHESD